MNYLKQHWQLAAGGVFGLLLLFYLVRKMNAGGPSPSSADVSSAGAQALNAAASLQNAQVNGQVETAQLSAQVASNQVSAQLQANLALTAAQEATTSQKIAADTVVQLGAQTTAVQLQHILSDTSLATTKIQSDTITTLGKTAGQTAVALQAEKNKVALQSLADSNALINYGVTHDTGHVASYLSAIAPDILAITGQGNAAASVAASNTAKDIHGDATSIISTVSGGISSLMSGLFG